MRFLPDTESILTGGAIVLLAVFIWTAVSVLRGNIIDPVETIVFAFVFAFVYFTGLHYLSNSSTEQTRPGE